MLRKPVKITGGWFQTCFIFHFIKKGCHPDKIDELHHFSLWLKHVKTTNQINNYGLVHGYNPMFGTWMCLPFRNRE